MEIVDIINKLNAIDSTAKRVAEKAEHDIELQMALTQKVTENSISVGDYTIDIAKVNFAGTRKQFYTVLECGEVIEKDLGLFESALGIVKSLMLGKYNRVNSISTLDTEYTNSLYEVYMHKNRARKGINEDVALAKLSRAQEKLDDAKSKIMKRL